MSGISFTGIGSGLPVNDIVNGLVDAEKAPFEQRTNVQRTNLDTSISAVGALKSELDKLQSSLENLTSSDNFQKRSISGGDDFIDVTSDKTAQTGSFDIQVNNLAAAHKVISSTFTNEETLGAGTISMATSDGNSTFDVDISDTDTLKDIRDKINNADDNDSTTATIITDADGAQRLVMSAKETGIDNALKISVSGASGRLAELDKDNADPATKLTELTQARDASITVDGTINLTSSTNEFKNAIQGVTIDVKKAHDVDDDTSSIAVSENNNIIKDTLTKFVAAYNAYNDIADEIGKSGGEGETGGILSGDSMLRSLNSGLRNFISSPYDTSDGGTLTLGQLGVTTDRYGELSFDDDLLNEQLERDPDAVQSFFLGSDANPGFAVKFDQRLESYTQSDGLLDGRVDSYNNQLKDLDESVEDFNTKMDRLEARLFSQYNAMDSLVAGLNASSSGALAQLQNVPNYGNNR
ncbi:flagellar filament capping protein FliD [Psychrobium sp. nBUS_13]|uniref:flagellar filament capping protein FliD n=1 Tax=Psychrobium sp. nBUS_13 TaxID=3395319 RepID=UPI003EB7C577